MKSIKETFPFRRFIFMLLGIVILGFGTALSKLSLQGNDPAFAMCIAIGEKVNIPYGYIFTMMNLCCFIVELILWRKFINLGTFVHMLCTGHIAAFFATLISSFVSVPENFIIHLCLMVAGVVFLSLGASLYQTADMGIAPYDSLSLIMEKKLPLPYFWCRIITDAFCTLVTIVLGGIFGVGTVFAALGTGPIVAFFNRTVSNVLMPPRKE